MPFGASLVTRLCVSYESNDDSAHEDGEFSMTDIFTRA